MATKFTISPEFKVASSPLVSGVLSGIKSTSVAFSEKLRSAAGFFKTVLRKERDLEIAFGERVIGVPREKQEEFGTPIDFVAFAPIVGLGLKLPGAAKKTFRAVQKISQEENIIQEFGKKISWLGQIKKAPLGQRIKTRFSQFYTQVVNRFNPIVKLTRETASEAKIPPGANPALLASRYLGVKGIAESNLFYWTSKLNIDGTITKTGGSLSDILGPAKVDVHDLSVFMVAQREQELFKRGITKGIDVKKSEQLINSLKTKYKEGFAQLEEVSIRIRDWSVRALLDPLKEVGALSVKNYNKIVNSNEFYVPFQRVMDEIDNFGVVGSKVNVFDPKKIPLNKIKGSERIIINPLESIVRQTYKITDFVERQRVANGVVNLRVLFPDLESVIKPVTRVLPVAEVEGETIFRISKLEPGKNFITTFENGVKKIWEVPADLAESMKGMTEGSMQLLTRLLNFPTKVLRAGAILSPEFVARNPIRDQMMAFVQGKYNYIPGVDLVKGLFESFGKRELFGKYIASGAGQATIVDMDRIGQQKVLVDVIGKSKLQKTGEYFKSPIKALQWLTEKSEIGTRLGAFKKAIKKTNDLEAMLEARDITLDFSRIGSQTRFLNRIIAFFNAQIQGVDKYARAMKERPVETTIKTLAGITLPSMAEYLLQKDNPRYQELPQWRRTFFWNIVTDIKTPLTPQGVIISIPKPFEVGIIWGSLPVSVLEWINENDPESLSSLKRDIIRGLTPGFIPTAFLPAIEVSSNYSFFRERPILGNFIRDLPAEMQVLPYTSDTAIKVGKFLSKVPGIKETKFASPVNIDHIFTGYTAGLGRTVLIGIEEVFELAGITERPERPARVAADVPLMRAFVAREPIGPGSESVSRFYDTYEMTRRANNGFNKLVNDGLADEAGKYYSEHREIDFLNGLQETAEVLSQLRQEIDIIRKSEDYSAEQKRRLIDAYYVAMTQEAKLTNQVLDSFKREFRE